MPAEKRYDIISVRPDHDIKPKLERLTELIERGTGLRVSVGDATALAINEAIASREKTADA